MASTVPSLCMDRQVRVRPTPFSGLLPFSKWIIHPMVSVQNFSSIWLIWHRKTPLTVLPHQSSSCIWMIAMICWMKKLRFQLLVWVQSRARPLFKQQRLEVSMLSLMKRASGFVPKLKQIKRCLLIKPKAKKKWSWKLQLTSLKSWNLLKLRERARAIRSITGLAGLTALSSLIAQKRLVSLWSSPSSFSLTFRGLREFTRVEPQIFELRKPKWLTWVWLPLVGASSR